MPARRDPRHFSGGSTPCKVSTALPTRRTPTRASTPVGVLLALRHKLAGPTDRVAPVHRRPGLAVCRSLTTTSCGHRENFLWIAPRRAVGRRTLDPIESLHRVTRQQGVRSGHNEGRTPWARVRPSVASSPHGQDSGHSGLKPPRVGAAVPVLIAIESCLRPVAAGTPQDGEPARMARNRGRGPQR
jgi:hypothetical protein